MLLPVSAPVFTASQPWALNFAAPPRIPLAGDINADGMADLICVYPSGDAIIDANLTVEGAKSGGGFQALPKWGRDCQAATTGRFDATPGDDVAGLFGGDELRLAGAFRDGHLTDTPNWVRLPSKLTKPVLATVGGNLLAFSSDDGKGFLISPQSRTLTPVNLPSGTVWVGDAGGRLAGQDANGTVFWFSAKFRRGTVLGTAPKGSRPAAARNWLAFGDKVWTPRGILPLPKDGLPSADSIRAAGDFDGDGDSDLIEYRLGTEKHTANQVRLRRFVSKGEKDPDHDGLTTEEEVRQKTDPYDPDTDNDALLDGWEVRGVRGLDLPALGCSPTKTDLVCLISRFEKVTEERLRAGMARVTRFYADLKTPNPDGTTGMRFHPVYLPPVTGNDTNRPWWENRDQFRPEAWRGIVHWMQVTPGGGGQADELGDGGGCGENALWAVFVHEFGHQIGLNHEGFWSSGWSPTYPSLMNYNYSYSLEDDGEKIRYSDGSLADFVIQEDDLDETLPLPYDRVKFLEKGPYRFRLKPNGDTTLIDWNWNGVFGEKHVRADINYAYSTHAGRRDDVGKSRTSPWLFVHDGAAYALFGDADGKAGDDPTLSPSQPGRLILRKLKKPYEWEAPETIAEGLTGDPVAASLGGRMVLAFPTTKGVVLRDGGKDRVLDPNPALVPSIGQVGSRLLIALWNPADGAISFLWADEPANPIKAAFRSANPVGIAVRGGEILLGMAEDQDKARPNRWQIRRLDAKLNSLGTEWVEGPDGQARGTGRLTLLVDRDGRLLLFGRGMTTKESPWACTYVAQEIGDRTVRGGWLVKRYYDEWTQSRSAPAAAWFGDDIIWAYRWVDGAQGTTDNNLHVGYAASGIQHEPTGDHDDLGFIRTFGIRNSLLSLGRG